MAYKFPTLATLSHSHSPQIVYTLATLPFSVHSFNILIFTTEPLQLTVLSYWNIFPLPVQMSTFLTIFRSYSNVTSSLTILGNEGSPLPSLNYIILFISKTALTTWNYRDYLLIFFWSLSNFENVKFHENLDILFSSLSILLSALLKIHTTIFVE